MLASSLPASLLLVGVPQIAREAAEVRLEVRLETVSMFVRGWIFGMSAVLAVFEGVWFGFGGLLSKIAWLE